jgi:hypothetical protein
VVVGAVEVPAVLLEAWVAWAAAWTISGTTCLDLRLCLVEAGVVGDGVRSSECG